MCVDSWSSWACVSRHQYDLRDPILALPLTRQAPSVVDVVRQATLVMTASKEIHVLQQHMWLRMRRRSPDEDGPEGEDQEKDSLVNVIEQEDAPLEGDQNLNELVKGNGIQGHP